MLWVKETEILVEQQPLQGVIVCGHASLVNNEFPHVTGRGQGRPIEYFESSTFGDDAA